MTVTTFPAAVCNVESWVVMLEVVPGSLVLDAPLMMRSFWACIGRAASTSYIQNPHRPVAITNSESARLVTPWVIIRSPSDPVRFIHQL